MGREATREENTLNTGSVCSGRSLGDTDNRIYFKCTAIIKGEFSLFEQLRKGTRHCSWISVYTENRSKMFYSESTTRYYFGHRPPGAVNTNRQLSKTDVRNKDATSG